MDTSSAQQVDLHRLDLRFAQMRLLEPRAVERLAASIERCGQLIACIAVPDGDERLVLVDGYRRVAALRRLGRDTACIEPWTCELTQALLKVMAGAQGRPLAVLEEALLLRELVHGQGLSQHEVARRSGRDVSWVSRRLQLLCGLPDALLAAVRRGAVSTWAATRVLAPLARANAGHAAQLLVALEATPLSTRELQCWFEHYRVSSHSTRDHLVAHPRLFIEAWQARDEQRADARLRDGPEGQCASELRQLLAIISRLRQRLPQLGPPAQGESLASALRHLRIAIDALQSDLRRYLDHDCSRDPSERADPAGAGPQRARDQPPAPAVAQHGAPGTASGAAAGASTAVPAPDAGPVAIRV
jgi:ParB-like chromosome segregation protein Spo0J